MSSSTINRCPDPEFWGTVYEERANSVTGTFIRAGINYHDAEDLTQETFIRAGVKESADTYDRERPIEPWLATARNRVTWDYWRRRYARPTPGNVYDEHNEVLPEADYQLESYEEQLVGSLVVNGILKDCLGRLGAMHREVFLDFYKGLSYEEIAEKAGISRGTVKSRLNRARAILAEHGESIREALQ